MKLKYTLSTLGLTLALAGCSLDVKMYDGVSAEDISNRNIFEVAQGSYRLLKNDNGIIQNGVFFWNYGADDLSWGGTSTDNKFKMYDYTRSASSTVTEYAWELAYRTIGNCNLTIEMVEALGNERTDKHTVTMGENYYLRALCYFLLVNEFAQPYSNNPTQNPGLPLKLNSDPDDLPQSRSTVAEIYDQVVNDLKNAITYMTLPDGMSPKANIYATKEAAEALLARVYLYMENYDEAYKMADAVIKSGRFELEKGNRYTTYSQMVPEDNKETIFAVRRTKLKDESSDGLIGQLYIKIDEDGWEEVYASSRYLELLELYHNEKGMPQDLRSKFIAKRYVEDGVEDFSISGYPNKEYKDWTFVYGYKKGIDYIYKQLSVEQQESNSYRLNTADAANYQSAIIHSEPYNLGTRYYVVGTDGTKYYGRIEPKVFDAYTKHKKNENFLVYPINKCSYQEQITHLWSPVISRLAEMYLIRAEVNAERGEIQLALNDVNELRRRAGIPEWTLENMKKAENGQPKDIKKLVEEERMLELAWEGHRRFDIFRKRQTLDRRYPGGHTMMSAGDKFLLVPYDSPAVCEFIPKAQLDAYPYDLEQNP
ncbi:RagB/SusD family nutrient uptake outer membrane protein [uncultured Bacteroides sp.]|uniref:RagB/SusD family nutrient uptake outer membrane protein n=1 Tax=uncultured Bacteroides sp. TaxID=162156 RepID=UPI0025D470A7|nr:RagB/SusD family nutrient uptake outer membrane protein [uncultured Bacteroides sp.]